MNEEAFQSNPEDVITGRAIPADMLRDFYAISSLEQSDCERVASALGKLGGLPDEEAVQDVISSSLSPPNRKAADSVMRALMGLTPDAVKKIVKSVERWANGSSERRSYFSEEAVCRLETNLGALIRRYPAISLMKKAEALLRDVGNEIQSVKFVCDLRPVFDDSRSRVEAIVSIANLRLVYVQQDGNRASVEIALTEQELRSLLEDAQQAVRKMEVLNELRGSMSITEGGESA